jgi:tRNA G37 N-methylase Trm5
MGRLSIEALIQERYNKSVKEVLQNLAEQGYTRTTAAKHLQCSASAITVHADKHGIAFKVAPQKGRSKKKLPQEVKQFDVQVSYLLSKKWV